MRIKLLFYLISLSQLNQDALSEEELDTYGQIPESEYSLIIKDNPEKLHFDFKLVSRAKRDICISREQWPAFDLARIEKGFSPYSGLHFAGKHVFITVENERIYVKDQNFGYCFDNPEVEQDYHKTDCAIIVAPGETLTGAYPYSFFKKPFNVNANKTFTFTYPIRPTYCDMTFVDPFDISKK